MNGFRLSPQQRRLFKATVGRPTRQEPTEPGSVERFRVIGVFELSGALDAERLEAARAALVGRYEILRTGFPPIPGLELPLQVPGDGPTADGPTGGISTSGVSTGGISRLDWSGGSAAAAEERLAELVDQALVAPMDAANGDLLRVWLATLGDSKHLLIWSQAALTADAASVGLLVSELLALYAADGSPSEDEPLQYADLAEWMNEILEGDDAAEGQAFWTEQLARASRQVLPFESARSESARSEGEAVVESLPIDLPRATLAAIDTFCAERDTTRQSFFLAIWSYLIARHSDADTVTLSTLFDGRSYEGLEEAIGPFARYLPLVVEHNEDFSLGDLIERVDQQSAAVAEWQEYFSWERVDAAATRQRHGFSYQRLSAAAEADGLRASLRSSVALMEPLTLELVATESGASQAIEIRFDGEAFDRERLEGLADSLVALVEDVLARPERRLCELAMLGPAARQRLVAAARREAPSPDARLVTEWIERATSERADRPAVVCGDSSLTYDEAWRRAGGLAAALGANGVGPGDLVAVCCERSVEMVVALLGVLRAGAAYLPLDPAHPDERLAFMLEDAGVRLAVCHAPTAERFGSLPVKALTVEALTVDAAAEIPPEPPTLQLEPGDLHPGDLAYIIYTSGSTGLPKAVAVTHSNLLHSTAARSHVYRQAPERFLLLSSFAFDSSIVGLFWTLSTGGTLIIPEEGFEQDPGLLADLIEQHRITHTLCLPTLYGVLLEQTPPERLRSLRLVVVAGEACSPDLARRHLEARPESTLVNEYGPTEATVWAITAELDSASIEPSVPIGDPIPHAAAYLLDPAGQPVPPGVVGEIHLGGAGVTRGYLGRPELTAERFVPDPFSGEPGARLYRTGDRGRIRPDGKIEFLGRFDHQVKLRGYRIEPGEIENRLEEIAGVRQAVVVARPSESGEDRLVAYLVPSSNTVPTVSELRASLQQALPEYMIPAIFVPLEEMPLTPTGKVDTNALPEPEQQRPDLADAYEPAASSLESHLVGRWEEILETEPIGVNDSFFELGGNSIQAAIFMNRIRAEIDDFIHVGRLFENPTVRSLAAYLESEHAGAIGKLDSVAGPAEEEPIQQAPEAEALDRIDSMSDTEVDSMLATLLAEDDAEQ